MRRLALAIVALHAAILLGHDSAHSDLVVELKTWQEIFVYPVIVAAPFAAAALLFTRHRRAGYALLALAMFGALAFGVVHHYVLVSSDHVAHLPPGDAQPLFRMTALLMAITEILGLGVGIYGTRAERFDEAS